MAGLILFNKQAIFQKNKVKFPNLKDSPARHVIISRFLENFILDDLVLILSSQPNFNQHYLPIPLWHQDFLRF